MNESWRETVVQASRPVRYAATAALGMLAIFLLVATIDGFHNWGQADTTGPNTITVSGEGTATAIPDTATVSFTSTATASDVATAESQMTDTTNSALSGVKALGISSDDITTTSYNVSPHYSTPVCPAGGVMCPSDSVVSGYDVSESISVKITDTTKVAPVLAALAKAGVTNVSGPDFVVADTQQVMQQAREQAIQKAQSDAKLLASQLGVHLGAITSFNDNTGGVIAPQPMFATAGIAKADVSTPSIPVGNNTYTDDVSITYEIN